MLLPNLRRIRLILRLARTQDGKTGVKKNLGVNIIGLVRFRRPNQCGETKVKRGVRIVHGSKEMAEKLGRNDVCPCRSGKRFKKCCLIGGCF